MCTNFLTARVLGIPLLLSGFLAAGQLGFAAVPGSSSPWGSTSLGTVLTLPPALGADAQWAPTYSPDGTAVAFRTAGALWIAQPDTGEATNVHAAISDNDSNRAAISCTWLTPDQLYVLDHTHDATPAQLASFDLSTSAIPGERFVARVVDWRAAASLSTASMTSPAIGVLGADTDGRWIVCRTNASDQSRWWRYNPADGEFECVWAELAPGERFWGAPRDGWYSKLVGSPSANPYGKPVTVEFVNAVSGESRRVENLPPLRSGGPLITGDGRYVISSTYEAETGRSRPFVVDMISSETRVLPASESWTPVDISNARGTVLVYLATRAPDGGWTSAWAEISLADLLVTH